MLVSKIDAMQLLQGGFLGDISDVATADGWDKLLPDSAMDVISHNGQVYAVPFEFQMTNIAWYNKAVLESVGIASAPQTWDELIAVAEDLQEAGYYAFANGSSEPWTLETLFGGVAPAFYGGTDFFDELVAGETDFSDPRFTEALERILALRPYLAPNHQGVNYSDMQTSFAFGMAGMLVGGSYELGTMENLNPELRVGSFPFPNDEGPGPVSVYVDGSYGISANSPHQDEALRFIEFLATREFGQMFTDTLQQLSAVPGVEPSGQELSDIVALVDADSTPYLFLTAFRFGQPSGSTLLQNELQAAMGDSKSIEEVAETIQQGLATWHPAFMD